MDVKLLASTGIYHAVRGAKMCYGDPDAANNMSTDEQISFLKKIISAGHGSVLEHAVFVFEINGISRACLQEIARHRHISLSVKSTRWALKKHTDYYIPEKLKDDMKKFYCEYIEHNMGIVENVRGSFGNDVAKYFAPEGITTSLVLTINLRELRYMFALRTSNKALKEFQDVMYAILNSLPEKIQDLVVFENTDNVDELKSENTFLKNMLIRIFNNVEYDSNSNEWETAKTAGCVHVFNGLSDYLINNKLVQSD